MRPISYLLRWVWQTRELVREIEERTRHMATQADINALNDRLSAASDSFTTGLQGVRDDIQALKDANPGVDTTALEASVARVEAGAAALSQLDAENPTATPVDSFRAGR